MNIAAMKNSTTMVYVDVFSFWMGTYIVVELLGHVVNVLLKNS